MKIAWIFSIAMASLSLGDAAQVYVTNYNDNSISVFDTVTNTVSGYVDTGEFIISNPVDIRHSRDGTKAYLLADFSNAAFVIDTSTDAITSEIDSTLYPFSAPVVVSFTIDGTKAYVSNEGTNQLSIIDVSTDTITGYVNDPEGTFNCPIGIAFSPDGTKAYVANYTGSTISIVDVSTDTVTGIVDMGSFSLEQPTFLDFITNSKVYVCSLNSDEVAVINANTDTMTGFVTTGIRPFSVPFAVMANATGTLGLVTNAGSNNISNVLALTNSVTGYVSGAVNTPRLIGVTVDNLSAYVTNMDDNTVTIINLALNTVLGTVSSTGSPFNGPYAISISPSLL